MHFHDPEVGYKVAAGLFKRGVLVAARSPARTPSASSRRWSSRQELLDQVLDRLSDTLAETEEDALDRGPARRADGVDGDA